MIVTPSKGQNYLAMNKGTGDSPTSTTNINTALSQMPPTPRGSSKLFTLFLPLTPSLHAASQDCLFPTYADCDTGFCSQPASPASCGGLKHTAAMGRFCLAAAWNPELKSPRGWAGLICLFKLLCLSAVTTLWNRFFDPLRTNDQMTEFDKRPMDKANLLKYLSIYFY